MSSFYAASATDNELRHWDQFVDRSCNGTLFHLRRFLAYHKERFAGQERHVVLRKGEQVFGQLSYAVSETEDGLVARSPYGGSYGGPAVERPPSYGESCGLIAALLDHIRESKIKRFTITPPLPCCARASLDTLAFAMVEQGFVSRNRDVSSIVALQDGPDVQSVVTGRARNMARKAERGGVSVAHGAPVDDFWPLMEHTFMRHGATPPHRRDEIADLLLRLPDRVRLDVAYCDGVAIAGAAIFTVNKRVATSFYLCQSDAGRDSEALSLVIMAALEHARANGFAYFDFGTSTHRMSPRPNLFRFKESFGAAGQFRETLEYAA